MDVIEANFIKVGSTLADGTLRLIFDIEPRHAQAAFALFHSPGTPAALARLISPRSEIVVAEEKEFKSKIGHNCISACDLCKDKQFQSWSKSVNEEDAKQFILSTCKISSRKELDSNQEAANIFRTLIIIPFKSWYPIKIEEFNNGAR
jgi:hypothetical protein